VLLVLLIASAVLRMGLEIVIKILVTWAMLKYLANQHALSVPMDAQAAVLLIFKLALAVQSALFYKIALVLPVALDVHPANLQGNASNAVQVTYYSAATAFKNYLFPV
jgi:hypothetical protein